MCNSDKVHMTTWEYFPCTTRWSLPQQGRRCSCATHPAGLHTGRLLAAIVTGFCTLKFHTSKKSPAPRKDIVLWGNWRQHVTQVMQTICPCRNSVFVPFHLAVSLNLNKRPFRLRIWLSSGWKGCMSVGWKGEETAEVRKMLECLKMLEPGIYSRDFLPFLVEDSLRSCLYLYMYTSIHKRLGSMYWLNNYVKSNWPLDLPDQFKKKKQPLVKSLLIDLTQHQQILLSLWFYFILAGLISHCMNKKCHTERTPG